MRCVIITVFRAKVLGEEIDLIPTGKVELCGSRTLTEGRRATAFVLPSLSADLKVRAYGQNGEELSFNLVSAYASAAFLSEVRGIPFEDLLVDTPEGSYKFIKDGRGGRVWLDFVGKAKFSEPCSLETMGVSTDYRVATGGYGRLAVLECKALDSFEPEVLRLTTASHNGWCGSVEQKGENLPIGGAFVYTRADAEITAVLYLAKGTAEWKVAALSALSALLGGRGKARLQYGGAEYTLICREGRVLLSLPVGFDVVRK